MQNEVIIERWRLIMARIRALSADATLIAVSKSQPAEAILPLLEAGQRDFGENRVSEALAKWPALKARYPGIKLHLIGSLQTNKVKDAVALFDAIHTVDRENLVDALVKERIRTAEGCGQFFLQVNTGEEPQKGGVAPDKVQTLMRDCTEQKLPVSGLMCVPPADDLPAPHFALLAMLARKMDLSTLSMGMSGDYETALRLGATHVRIGTALFGERPKV